MTIPWYTVRTRTRHGCELSAPFGTLDKARAYADAVRTNPDVTEVLVLRSAPPVAPYDGPTVGKTTPNINDQATWERYHHVLIEYAPIVGDHHAPTENTWEQSQISSRPLTRTRTDVEKAEWAKSHPNPIPHRGVR